MNGVMFVKFTQFLLFVAADAVIIDNCTDFCRPWTLKHVGDNKCQCAPSNELAECSENDTIIKYQACATYNENTKEAVVGMCPYNALELQVERKFIITYSMENRNLTSKMCEPLNRAGLLCSHCKPGLGPALLNYSHPCLECTGYNGWVAYFAATLIPANVFLLIIIAFQVDAQLPVLNFYMFHCQLMMYYFKQAPSLPHSLKAYCRFFPPIYKTIVTLYGFWNLDFFRPFIPSFCAKSDMNILAVLSLEYVVAIYPLLLIAAVYFILEMKGRGCWLLNFMWKPFHSVRYRFKKAFNIRGSIINAFATFISLSHFKILMVSFDIASQTSVYSSAARHYKHRLYFNASVEILDTGNLPYFVLASAMVAIFCVLPLLVLVFGSAKCRRLRCLYKCTLLREVLKVYYKHFKDGSNGTSDYRCFSALYFAIRIFFLLSSYLTYTYRHYVRCLLFLTAALLFSCFRPYKKSIYNFLDSFWFTQLTIFTLTILYQIYIASNKLNMAVLVLGGTLPLFCACIYTVFQCGKILLPHLSCCRVCLLKCCRKRNHGSMICEETEGLPERLINSAEYRPLLAM